MQSPKPPHRSLLVALFLSPNEPRLRAGWRILGHFTLLLVIFTLATSLLFFVFTPGSQHLVWVGQVAGGVAITLATFLSRRWLDQRSITSLGLRWDKKSLIDLLFGIALPGLMMFLILILEWAFGWLEITSIAWSNTNLSEIASEVLLGLLVFVFVGWQEELLNRGYWLQNLADGIGLPLALVVSSILFAFAHLVNPNISAMGIVGLTAAGLFLAYGYLVTRQLWLPIGLHIGWNFFEGTVFGFPVSGTTDFFSLLNLSRNGPVLLTGGAFGPEAGLLQYPILLLGVWAIFRYTRRHRNKS